MSPGVAQVLRASLSASLLAGWLVVACLLAGLFSYLRPCLFAHLRAYSFTCFLTC